MGKKITLLFNRAPYGTIYLQDGLKVGVGLSGGIEEHEITAIFVGDGVYFGLRNLDKSIVNQHMEGLKKFNVPLLMEVESLNEKGIEKERLSEEFEIIDRKRVLKTIMDGDFTISF